MATGGRKKATYRPTMRRKSELLGQIRRDGAGNVTMIRLIEYKDNPLAPTALVSKVGGIYRVNTHLIRCTFVDEIPNADGVLETIATSHLVWKTERDWLDSRNDFAWVMAEFAGGTFSDAARRRQ